MKSNMDGPFEYFDSKSIFSLKVVIGTALSHQLVKWIKDDGELLSVEEVNILDRKKLAQEFINLRSENGKYKIDEKYILTRPYLNSELINDIARFIDLKIPKNYWLRLLERENGYEDRTITSKLYPGIYSVEGLKFIYPENYQAEKIELYNLFLRQR